MVFSLLAAGASAFTLGWRGAPPHLAGESLRMNAATEGVVKPTAGRINNMVDLDSPKVATMCKLSEVEGNSIACAPGPGMTICQFR